MTKIGSVSEISAPRNKTSTVVKNSGIKSQTESVISHSTTWC